MGKKDEFHTHEYRGNYFRFKVICAACGKPRYSDYRSTTHCENCRITISSRKKRAKLTAKRKAARGNVEFLTKIRRKDEG